MSEKLGDAILELRTDSKKFDQGVDRSEKKTKGLEKNLKKTSLAAVTLKMKLLAVGVALAGITIVSKRLLSGILSVSASFEQMRLQLDVLTKGKGTETLERLNKWALTMPVNTQKAVRAFVTMQAFGLDPTIKKLQILTNVAVIFGEETLGRVSRALGQMKALGKLSAEELNQLSEVGINARNILKGAFGLTVEELQKSKITIDEVIDALWKGMSVKFAGAAKMGMKTWQGLTSVFKSYVAELQRQIGAAGVFEALKDSLEDINTGLGDWIENNDKLVKDMTTKTIGAVNDLAIGLKNVFLITKGVIDVFKLPFDLIDLLTDKALSGLKKLAKEAEKQRRIFSGELILAGTAAQVPRGKIRFGEKIHPSFSGEGKAKFSALLGPIEEAGEEYQILEKTGIDTFASLENAVTGWASSFSSTMTDVLFGAEATFGNILESFAKMITQMIIQTQLINPLLRAGGILGRAGLQGGIASILGGGGGFDPAGILGTPQFVGPLPQLANGGIVKAVTGGRIVKVAEGGEDEVIAPLSKLGGMGGNVEVNIIGAPEGTRVREGSNSSGGRRLDVILDEQVANLITPGTKTVSAINKTFNMSQKNIRR